MLISHGHCGSGVVVVFVFFYQEFLATCLNVVKGRYITTVRKIRWRKARHLKFACTIWAL